MPGIPWHARRRRGGCGGGRRRGRRVTSTRLFRSPCLSSRSRCGSSAGHRRDKPWTCRACMVRRCRRRCRRRRRCGRGRRLRRRHRIHLLQESLVDVQRRKSMLRMRCRVHLFMRTCVAALGHAQRRTRCQRRSVASRLPTFCPAYVTRPRHLGRGAFTSLAMAVHVELHALPALSIAEHRPRALK